MMNSLKFEAYQIGVYCDTVYMILEKHTELSIVKLIFFAYAINKERFFGKRVYDAKNTKNIISKEISIVSGDFIGYANAVPYIIKAIHILSRANKIKIENNIAHLTETDNHYIECNRESKFVYNVIEESKKWSDRRFMREVLHNV